jgi:hypothetical protein
VTGQLNVGFPPPWATVRGRELGRQDAGVIVGGIVADLGAEAAASASSYFETLVPALAAFGLDALAALTVVDESGVDAAQAFCAVGAVSVDPQVSLDDGLWSVAESGPHPGLDRQTTRIDLPLGTTIRSEAFRLAIEALDDDGVAPYVAEVRYAFAIDHTSIGFMHFETQTLVYYDELMTMFDAIVRQARLS